VKEQIMAVKKGVGAAKAASVRKTAKPQSKRASKAASKRSLKVIEKSMRWVVKGNVITVRLDVASAQKVVGPVNPPRQIVLTLWITESDVPQFMAAPLVTGPARPPQ
jgi:hypothetical protein